jgi:Flp pilus assembly protein TadG/cytoskeletal protein CcmA (bactofilin family)
MSLVFLSGMTAFAVDVGYVVHVRTELQRTADASVFAAVRHLPNTTDALAAAKLIAIQNQGLKDGMLSGTDVDFGYWDRETATYQSSSTVSGTGLTVNGKTYANVNAVRVTLQKTSARGNPVQLFFGPILGRSVTDVSAAAMAVYDQELCGPLVGIDSVWLHGNPLTDSYRSALGPYDSQIARSRGDLCSDGPIDLDGTALVKGNANAGKGFSTDISGSSVVTGNTTPRMRPLNLPNVDTTDVSATNDNNTLEGQGSPFNQGSRDFRLQPNDANDPNEHKVYDLPPGTYYFDDLVLHGQTELRISGETIIYLTGDLITAGSSLVNSSLVPNNLKIFMAGEGNEADLQANVDFHGVLYAPEADVTVSGSGELFGVVVGKTLDVKGTGEIHYDENLDLSDELNLPRRTSLVQ